MSMKQEQLDSAAVAASKTTWIGAAFAGVFGGLSINEALGIAGFVLAVGGFVLNWYYRRKADTRAQRLFELREKRLLQGREDNVTFDDIEHDE